MIKAYLKSRLVMLLMTLSIILTLLFSIWLYSSSLQLFWNFLFFVSIPMFLIIAIDIYHFYQEWTCALNMKDYVEASEILKSNDPIANIYISALIDSTQKAKQYQSSYEHQEKDMIDTLQLWTHQIKTPLTALDLIMQMKTVNNRQARLEITKINRYLMTMLNYLKLTTLNTDLVLERLSLQDLVRKQVRGLSSLFIAKDLSVIIGDLPIEVVSDSQWLGFILEQLLTNAIKYTSKGAISIYWQDEELVVKDTGIGILSEDLPRIFERGFSGYNGRANKKATGLGLFLSQQIAEKLGLKLYADSTVGVGSQFYIQFSQQTWPTD